LRLQRGLAKQPAWEAAEAGGSGLDVHAATPYRLLVPPTVASLAAKPW
jgi:hypothetical protein